jgi:hypothetical protein
MNLHDIALRRVFSVSIIVFFMITVIVPSFAGVNAAESLELRVVTAITDAYVLPTDQPAAADGTDRIEMMATPGEYEPASFVIYARERLDAVSIVVSDFQRADGVTLDAATVDVRIVKRWYQTAFGEMADRRVRFLRPELLVYDDRLIKVEDDHNYLRLETGEYRRIDKLRAGKDRPILSPSDWPVRDAVSLQPFTLPAGENRQLWLTLHAPENAEPGIYQGQVRVSAADSPARLLPVQIEILPFVLAESVIEYSIYYRGYLDPSRPEGSISQEVKSEAQFVADLRNMRAHGIVSPTVYQRYPTGLFDTVMRLYAEAGMQPKRLYYLGLNVVSNNEGRVPPSLGRIVKETNAKAKAYGIEQVYFYARDEARDEALTYQFPFWDEVRRHGGKIMVAGWQTDAVKLGNFDLTGGKEDLFVSMGTVRKPEADRWHSQGRLIYSYQNPLGGYELPHTYRRNYGLLLWQYNYDGAMPYAWQDGGGSTWNDFDHIRHREINFSYPTVDTPVDTIQWEGFREGVDDIRYLSTLLKLVEQVAPKRAVYARRWLADLRESTLGTLDLDTVRETMTSHILYLLGAETVAVDTATEIGKLDIAQLDAEGRGAFSWQTPVRSAAVLELGRGANSLREVAAIPVPSLRQRLITPAIDKGIHSFRASAYAAEGERLAERIGSFDVSPSINLEHAEVRNLADALVFNAEVSSAWHSSVALDIDRSLLGWWRFSDSEGDSLKDASSWGRAATLKGGAVISPGRYGNGVELAGDGEFVLTRGIEIPENGTATIEGWFWFGNFAMELREQIGLFSGMYQHPANNHFYFTGTNDHYPVSSLLRLRTWHHIVLSWDGDVLSSRMYIDGQPVYMKLLRDAEDIGALDGVAIGSGKAYLGGLIKLVSGTFPGRIDEFRVWGRVLSASEVSASYSAGRNAKLQLTVPVERGSTHEWSVIGANVADQMLTSESMPIKAD